MSYGMTKETRAQFEKSQERASTAKLLIETMGIAEARLLATVILYKSGSIMKKWDETDIDWEIGSEPDLAKLLPDMSDEEYQNFLEEVRESAPFQELDTACHCDWDKMHRAIKETSKKVSRHLDKNKGENNA